MRQWSSETNSLEAIPEEQAGGYWTKVSEAWDRGLSPYRQSASGSSTEAETVDSREGNWEGLIKHVTPQILTHFLQGSRWEISSSSSMLRDRDHIPGLTPEETGLEEPELGGLGIDLKRTWREGAMGRERTEGAMDAGWALGDVGERDRRG